MKALLILLLAFLAVAGNVYAQQHASSFKVIPLGVKGGLDEGNLSAYMLAVEGTEQYVCLDAGTVYDGIQKAVDNGLFKQPAIAVLKNSIKGYLISHPHLDHVAGLIMNSPADTAKNIYGTTATINALQKHYFSWESWANFGDAGEKPMLKKYHYVTLGPQVSTALGNTGMSVKAFTLSHSTPYESTAFLINSSENYLLYLGDTGADTVEHSTNLNVLWQAVSPLIKAGQLKAIFIEVSFDNEQPEKLLFGHLTPRLLMSEMSRLAGLCAVENLQKVPVVITHVKPSERGDALIRQELQNENNLRLKLVFPKQAELLQF
ncbi:MAG TPA: 3',5'-cyclic-nucleotide phosphodiesterase [Panacibacter sp.]|nr:3',5'-cyclic-nucleotide phosphodiesterase [Panacibacter sp.]HNP43518.1 3',5'-cyclic-nucleotide phosphodiesterase [Panacibacter sp.]